MCAAGHSTLPSSCSRRRAFSSEFVALRHFLLDSRLRGNDGRLRHQWTETRIANAHFFRLATRFGCFFLGRGFFGVFFAADFLGADFFLTTFFFAGFLATFF
jgi:hypothetical protein